MGLETLTDGNKRKHGQDADPTREGTRFDFAHSPSDLVSRVNRWHPTLPAYATASSM